MIEICGDGLNLGNYECDDGNNFDGDGCSSDCKIESGYGCETQPNKLDICRDNVPPTATGNMKEGNTLVIKFSETVILKSNSEFLSKKILINIITNENCKFSWYFNDKFNKGKILSSLLIQ